MAEIDLNKLTGKKYHIFVTDEFTDDEVFYYKSGGMLDANERYVLEIKGLTGLRKEAIERYIEENRLSDNDVLNIIIGLGRKQLKRNDVASAVVDKKGNDLSKKVIEFAKDNKGMKLYDGGEFQSGVYADGGFVNWQKYPTKNVRGLYEIKGDEINRKVNIVAFERNDDELYSLYPLDKDKHLFKEILVKSNALNSLDKGISVQGETNEGKKVSIKRISNQDFSYAKGGSLIGNQNRIDLNHNGEIDAEDFKLLRSTMNGAWRNDHEHINSTDHKQDYEVSYARKNKSDRTGYKGKTNFAYGGSLNEHELFLELKNSLKPNQRGANESKLLGYTMYEKNGEYEITRKIDGNEVDVTHLFKKFLPYKSNEKFAEGGGIDTFSEYSNDALYDMIINLSRYENTESEIQMVKAELEKRKGGKTEQGVDLFEDYENIPPKLQAILEKYEDAFENGDYRGLQKALEEANKIGYTFEYYLDGQAYDLRKIGEKGKSEVEEYATGGGFEKLSKSVAKKYEGKRVKPAYQKEYGKVYSKEEAKEVGDKVAGKVKANQKMASGGETKKGAKGGIMVLAKKIRKEGESWQDALKRAGQQLK